MSVNLTIAGTVYAFPTEGEEGWGSVVTQWATAVSSQLLQRTGGSFSLSAEVDFGATFATKQAYIKSRTANIAAAGFARLARTDTVSWRNQANGADLALGVDASNRLTFNGNVIIPSTGVIQPTEGGTGISTYATGDTLYASASNVLSKLTIGAANTVNTSNGTIPAWALLVNANIDPAAAIAYSKLALTASIVNADVSGSAAIDWSKMAALTASKLLESSAGGVVTPATSSGYPKLSSGTPTYSATIPRADVATATAYRILANSAGGAMSENAALTAAHVIFADANGQLSGEATLSKSRGGAGADMSSVTFPSTGTLATLAAVQAFTNKTFSDAITGAQIATPSAPAAGFNQLYFKSDNTLYTQTPGGVEAAIVTSASGEPRQNWIINGAMDYWQRGTSMTSIAGTATYGADRFKYARTAGANVVSLLRSTDVPTLVQASFQANYSYHIDVTTADAAVAAGDLSALTYTMEGYEWGNLREKQVTISFWVKATKTGTSCIAFRNSGSDRSYVAEFTINSTGTWEQKTVTLTLNPSGGTNDYTTGAGLQISWCLIGGTTFQTTAGSWQTGNFLCTSGQVNHMDSTSNDFRLAMVQLNIGSSASAFQRAAKNIGEEVELCERYYQKSYDIDVAPGTSTSTGSNRWRIQATGFALTALSYFRTRMRTSSGTNAVYSITGAIDNVRNTTAGANAAVSYTDNGQSEFSFTAASGTDQDVYAWQWTNDCDF